jgi:hypothetical protein
MATIKKRLLPSGLTGPALEQLRPARAGGIGEIDLEIDAFFLA